MKHYSTFPFFKSIIALVALFIFSSSGFSQVTWDGQIKEHEFSNFPTTGWSQELSDSGFANNTSTPFMFVFPNDRFENDSNNLLVVHGPFTSSAGGTVETGGLYNTAIKYTVPTSITSCLRDTISFYASNGKDSALGSLVITFPCDPYQQGTATKINTAPFATQPLIYFPGLVRKINIIGDILYYVGEITYGGESNLNNNYGEREGTELHARHLISGFDTTFIILPKISSTQPGDAVGFNSLIEKDGKLFFFARDSLVGSYQLWMADSLSITKLSNIGPRYFSGVSGPPLNPFSPGRFFIFAGDLYFTMRSISAGTQLYKYTVANGVEEILDSSGERLDVDESNTSAKFGVEYGGDFYFFLRKNFPTPAISGKSQTLVKLVSGSTQVVFIDSLPIVGNSTGNGRGNISSNIELGSDNKLYFSYTDSLVHNADLGTSQFSFDTELWRYDLTTNIFEQLTDLGGEDNLHRFTSTNSAYNNSTFNNLDAAQEGISDLIAVNGDIYFTMTNADTALLSSSTHSGTASLYGGIGKELYKYDVTNDTVVLVRNLAQNDPTTQISLGSALSPNFGRLTKFDNKLYFIASYTSGSTSHLSQLWSYDPVSDNFSGFLKQSEINPSIEIPNYNLPIPNRYIGEGNSLNDTSFYGTTSKSFRFNKLADSYSEIDHLLIGIPSVMKSSFLNKNKYYKDYQTHGEDIYHIGNIHYNYRDHGVIWGPGPKIPTVTVLTSGPNAGTNFFTDTSSMTIAGTYTSNSSVLTVKINGTTYTDGDGNLTRGDSTGAWTLSFPSGHGLIDSVYDVVVCETYGGGAIFTDTTVGELTINFCPDPLKPSIRITNLSNFNSSTGTLLVCDGDNVRIQNSGGSSNLYATGQKFVLVPDSINSQDTLAQGTNLYFDNITVPPFSSDSLLLIVKVDGGCLSDTQSIIASDSVWVKKAGLNPTITHIDPTNCGDSGSFTITNLEPTTSYFIQIQPTIGGNFTTDGTGKLIFDSLPDGSGPVKIYNSVCSEFYTDTNYVAFTDPPKIVEDTLVFLQEDYKTVADLVPYVTGTNLTWYLNEAPTGGTPINLTDTLISGGTYVVTQTVGGCPSSGFDFVRVILQLSIENEQEIIPNQVSGEGFGSRIDFDCNKAVVGAPTSGSNNGAVYVYERSGGVWVLEQTLTPPTTLESSFKQFGSSVAIDGDQIVVGSRNRVHVFEYSSSTWSETAQLTPSVTTGQTQIGTAVDIESNRIVFGTRSTTGAGSIWVFDKTAGTWTETFRLQPSDNSGFFFSSKTLSLSGNKIISSDKNQNTGTGKAYVWVHDGTSWNESILTASDGVVRDYFGTSVSIDGNRAVVGAEDLFYPGGFMFSGINPSMPGKAYVYELTGTTWSETAILQMPDGTNGDMFGHDVEIDGTTVVSSAVNQGFTDGPQPSSQNPTGQGAVYRFELNGSNWQFDTKYESSDISSGDNFGGSVALCNGEFFVGAPKKSSNNGGMYFFGASNTAPTNANDTVMLAEDDSATNIKVLTNNMDADGDSIYIDTAFVNSGATITVKGDSTIDYVPAPDFCGTDSVFYGVTDGKSTTQDTLFVFVACVSDTISDTINENTPLTLCDTNLIGGTADSVVTCNDPVNGAITISSNCATYTPDSNFFGNDTLCLIACKGGVCDTTIVTLTVSPKKDTITQTTDKNTPLVLCDTLINGFTTDSISLCGAGTNGTGSITGNCYTYTPNTDYFGTDEVCIISCVNGICDTTIVNIVINPGPSDYSFGFIPEDSLFTICDTTLAGINADSLSLLCPSQNGTTTITGGCLTYVPDTNYIGNDSICVLTCKDGVCDTTIIKLKVAPGTTDTIPLTLPEGDSIVICDTLLNGITADSVLVCNGGTNGTSTLSGGCVTYSPTSGYFGVDTLCIIVCNDSICDTTIVNITVQPLTDTLTDSVSQKGTFTLCDTSLIGTSADSVIICGQGSNGTTTVTGGCATYTPNSQFVGNDTLCILVCKNGVCDTTRVELTVLPEKDTISKKIFQDSTYVICDTVLNGFTADSTVSCGTPSNGAITGSGNCLTYTPTSGYQGNDTLCIAVCNDGVCDTTIIMLNVAELTFPCLTYFQPGVGNLDSLKTTATSSFNVTTQIAATSGLAFNNTGTKVYVTDRSTRDVTEYTLTNPYDLTSGVLSPSVTFSFTTAPSYLAPYGIAFNNDGSKMYIPHRYGGIVEYALSTPFDVSTSVYTFKDTVTDTQDDPNECVFSTDGTKLYMVGATSPSSVFEYSLSTAFDIGTLSYTGNSFSLSGEFNIAQAIDFNSDGSKMFISGATATGSNDNVVEYSLSSPFDFSTAPVYKSGANLVTPNNNQNGIRIHPDGDRLYTIDHTDETIREFTFNTANFVETSANAGAVQDSLVIVLKNDTFQDIDNDNLLDTTTEVFIANVSPGLTPVLKLTDNDTRLVLTFSGNALDHENVNDVADLVVTFTNLAFVNNAAADVCNSNLYSTGMGIDYIDEICTDIVNDTLSISVPGGTSDTNRIVFAIPGRGDSLAIISSTTTFGTSSLIEDDTAFVYSAITDCGVIGTDTIIIYAYSPLGTNCDTLTVFATIAAIPCPCLTYFQPGAGDLDSLITTANASFNVTTQVPATSGVVFNNDGTKVYVSDRSTRDVTEFSLTIPYDLTSAVLTPNVTFSFTTAPSYLAPYGITFSTDGSKMYVTHRYGGIVEYTLSTPYDISTSVYSFKDTVTSTQDNRPYECAFSNDGTKMYVSGSTSPSSIYEYNLSTPYDIRTASYTSNSLDISSELNYGAGIDFNADGTKLYISGNPLLASDDNIVEYTLSAPFDFSTAPVLNSEARIAGIGSLTQNGIFIHPDGDRLYTIDHTDETIREFTFNTADFVEVAANNGAVQDSLVIILKNDTFQDIDNDNLLDTTTEVSIANVSPGLTPVLKLTDNDTRLVVTFTGNALNHEDSNDVADLVFTFEDTAFLNYSASKVCNSTSYSSGMGIDYRDRECNEIVGPTAKLTGDTLSLIVSAGTSDTTCLEFLAKFELSDTLVIVTNPKVVGSTTSFTSDTCFVYSSAFSNRSKRDTVKFHLLNNQGFVCDSIMVEVLIVGITDTITDTVPEDGTTTLCDTNLIGETADSVVICNGGSNGMTSLTGNCATYTPNANYIGNDTLCLITCNDGVCDTTIVTITVGPGVTDTITTTIIEDSTVVFCDTLLNGINADSVVLCNGGSNGTTTISGNCFSYSPNTGFAGFDTTCFIVCNDGVCDTTYISIFVDPKPNLVCKPDTAYLRGVGTVLIDTSYTLSSITDNNLTATWLSKTTFDCSNVGPNNVTAYAIDALGQIDSCTSIITILDTIAPMAMCQNITINLDATGNASINAIDLDGGSTDNCSVASVVINKNNFDCSNVGANSVTLIVTDIFGNIDSCIATVTVVDTVTPKFTCLADKDTLIRTPDCSFIVPDYTSEVTDLFDNCDSANVTYTQFPSAGTELTTDNTVETITITATDAEGNSTICSFDVTVTCDRQVKVPQTFSPNGDGVNDAFVIRGIEYYEKSVIKIFNRWGSVVYETTNYQNDWKGTSQDGFKIGGSDLPVGTYFYTLDLGVGQELIKGYVYLIK